MTVSQRVMPPSQAYQSNHLGLTPEQKAAILACGAEYVLATAAGLDAQLEDVTLAGAADKEVYGAYVSLKRGPHLRGCCGGLRAQPTRLIEAVIDSAYRTVLEDPRFPVVASQELPVLDLEIWLLFNPQPVAVQGEERVDAVVTGGKHGVLIRRGQQTGLLLPGVAAERGWDSRTFLEQVCIKAGMHPSLWKDDATQLFTFEGEVLAAKLVDYVQGRLPPAEPFLSPAELEGYGALCRHNVRALMEGATPFYSHPGLRDGQVAGMVLSIRIPGREHPLELTQFSMRPGLALQGTLLQLAQAAARSLLEANVPPDALAHAEVEVAVLNVPMIHGTHADPDLRGFEPDRRALVLFERNRHGILYRPGSHAHEILKEVAAQTQVRVPHAASLFSVEVETRLPALAFHSTPRPRAGADIRPAAVAGRFYPDDPDMLRTLVDNLLDPQSAPEPIEATAAMTPHAGLSYSGRLAADVLRRIRLPRTIIVIGPKHTPLGMDWAIAPHRAWQIPGATLAADPDLARRLADAIPGLSLDAAAHQNEHAIEVELPFLARLAPDAKVVGIAVGYADLESCGAFARGLADVIRSMPEAPLLLISSDMNHFATDEQTRLLDEMALSALESLDPEKLYATVTDNSISMCGVMPAIIVLQTLRLLGRLRAATRVGYGTSADVTGDTSRVVGYAGMLFT
jgi:AmmeMemoRadiSam system protein B/AmmeMemoRadiSam system protein A